MGRAAYRHKCIPTAVGAWIRRRKYPGHHSKRRTTAHSTSVSPFPQQYSPPQRGRTAYRGKRGKTYQGTSSTHRGAYSHTCWGSMPRDECCSFPDTFCLFCPCTRCVLVGADCTVVETD